MDDLARRLRELIDNALDAGARSITILASVIEASVPWPT